MMWPSATSMAIPTRTWRWLTMVRLPNGPPPCRCCLATGTARSRRRWRSEPATARVASPSATSITMDDRIWPCATTGPITSRSCWATETEPSSPPGDLPVGVSPWDIVVYDFNGDQKSDLAVIGHWSDIVSILRGNGDGTFQPHIWFRTDRGPTGIALADFNGDGQMDLASANYFSTTISVLPATAMARFQAAQNFGVGMAPMGVAVGDFNRDGQPDLASGDYFSQQRLDTDQQDRDPAGGDAGVQPAGRHVHRDRSRSRSPARPAARRSITRPTERTPTAASSIYTDPIW